MGTLTISGPPLAIVGEAFQIGPIQVVSTITPVAGTIVSVGPATYTIVIPALAAGIALFPASSNTAGLTVRGNSLDTGFAIPRNAPSFLTFDTTAGGFNLFVASGGAAGTVPYVIF